MVKVTVAQLREFLQNHADDDLIDVGLTRNGEYIDVQLQVVETESHDIIETMELVTTYELPIN